MHIVNYSITTQTTKKPKLIQACVLEWGSLLPFELQNQTLQIVSQFSLLSFINFNLGFYISFQDLTSRKINLDSHNIWD